MGYWGVKSYEIDEAHDALDAAYELVHGPRYEELMDDGNPLTFEQVEKQLASSATLVKALAHLADHRSDDDEVASLALAGVVVRHAELGVEMPTEIIERALQALEHETLEWDETTLRSLRKEKEMALLRKRLAK